MRAPAGPLVLAVTAGLLVAGCSSSGGRGSTAQGAAQGGPATTTGVGAITAGGVVTTVPGQVEIRPEEDKKLAQSLVLVPADFPSGWTFADHANTSDAAVAGGVRATCLGLPDPGSIYTAIEAGQDAVSGGAVVQSSAVLMATATAANQEIVSLRGGKGKSCEQSATAAQLQAPAGATVTVKDLGAPPGSVPAGTVAAVAFRITATGGGATVYLDVVELQHDRAVTTLVLRSETSPFPPATEDDLITKLATRTGQAVTG